MIPLQRILLFASDMERDRFRPILRSLAGFTLLAEAPAAEDGFQLAQYCPAELILLGPGADEFGERLAAARPDARILKLSLEEDASSLMQRLASLECRFEALPPEKPSLKIIACYGAKGGAGRSTLAANLAIALRQATSRETFLVDAVCQQGELDLFLNLQPQQGLKPTPHPTGIQLLGWTKGEQPVTADKLKSLLLYLQARNAWVVVDTHPEHLDLNRAVLDLADRVFVPFFLDIAHLRALQRDFQRLRAEGVSPERFELIAWAEKSDLSRADAARILHQPIACELPHDPEIMRGAINQGVPLLQGDPHGAFARDLHKLIRPMLPPQTTALVSANPLSNLLAWLRRGSAAGFGT